MAGVSCLADIEAMEREVPLAERVDSRSTWELFAKAAARHAMRPALSFLPHGQPDEESQSWTYAELAQRARRLANLLHANGVGASDGVGILLPNVPEYYVAQLASQAVAVACPISPLLGTRAMAQVIHAMRCRVLICLGPERDAAMHARLSEVLSACPDVRLVLRVGSEMQADSECIKQRGFDTACAPHHGSALEFEPVADLAAPAARFHTGGTTGAPKVAVHSHLNHVYEAWAARELLEFRETDTVLIGLPLFHVHASIPLGLAPLSAGAHLVLMGPQGWRHPEIVQGFSQVVRRFGATVFSAVPTVYGALLAAPFESNPAAGLRLALCGSAPLAMGLARAFEQRTGVRILEGYGLTEGTCVSSLNPLHGERRIGSIGLRLPYQGMKAAVLSASGKWLRDCAVGETGALLIQGPNVFAGYTDAALTEASYAAPEWLDTGDLGHQDSDGYFWISGRAKDLIKRSGHSIDPKMIEECLQAHHGVLAAAVVGMPDERAGELPVAYVAAQPGKQIDTQALREHCRRSIADPTSLPAHIFALAEMPLTAVGKIDKVRLREIAAAASTHPKETP
jgi:fatty-acyl-CoA synthase